MASLISSIMTNKHGEKRLCWTCEHVEYVGDFEGTTAQDLKPVERKCMCRQRAAFELLPDALEENYKPFPVIDDGTTYWCSNWRRSTLPIPPIPPVQTTPETTTPV